jgi:hypothetical protein
MSIRKIPILKLRRSRFNKIAAFWNLGIIGNGAFLAGGAIRTLISDEEVADFDVFFDVAPISPEDESKLKAIEDGEILDFDDGILVEPPHPRVEEVKRILEREKFKLIFECPERKMFSYKKDNTKIQLILEIQGKPEEIINDFDFFACCAAFDGNFIYFPTQFVRDVKTKKLSINQITYPVATIKRMVKYAAKGYNINGACFQFMTQTSGAIFDEEQLRLYID